MAVKDESLFHATDSLILPSPRNYYRAYMHADHWQLRSFVSSPKEGIIYYPGGSDIYRLDTVLHERDIITTLPFSPRCLTSANGWICCGGERGDFAAIHLPEESHDTPSVGINLETGPGSRLPTDLESFRRQYLIGQLESAGRNVQRDVEPLARAFKVGTEIVNCVTLWFPKSNGIDQTYDTPVAVLSNNDHSVSIVDLQDIEVLEKLELGDCINRAVISPDGLLLIAIGDDPYMHIYRRKQKSSTSKGASGLVGNQRYTWTQCHQIQLPGQRPADKEEMRGSFAAAFSPSGRYLAVGTQYGIISIYDAQYLNVPDRDNLLTTFTTTRPNTKMGAVRAMEFSPEPFDLLAWTEDDGRVIIADIRHYFMSRQVIAVEPHAEGVDTVGIVDRFSDLVIDPRLRGFRAELDGATSDNMSAEIERRQLRYLSREVLDTPLTAAETEVLEAIQVSNRQREREAARDALASVTQHTSTNWSDLADDIRQRASTGERRPASSALPSSLREFVNGRTNESLRREFFSGRNNDSLRAYINERNQDRERRGQQPRRRGSVILAAAQTALDRDSREISRGPAGDLGATSREWITSMPPRLPAIRSEAHSNPWAEIEALYNIAIDTPVDPTARMRIEVEAEARRDRDHYIREANRDYLRETDNRREITRRLQRESSRTVEERNQLRLGAGHSASFLRSLRSEPAQTTGCCWSPDGRELYVGTENGIYELNVNVAGRKCFPSIMSR